MGWWRYYTPKPAREVKGGIKAHSRRGDFAASWWGKRWVKVLESFDIGKRLSRGRTYARKGQVMDIAIEKGAIQAAVQGSRSRPYQVKVSFRPLSRTQWRQVSKALADRFVSLARLLAGEMPEDIEEVFTSAGLSLFPHKLRDLETDCSCPDWSNPCKHTAAVFYLLAEEFDRDPFLLFKLRGLTREELFEVLGYAPDAPAVISRPDRNGVSESVHEESPFDPTSFWGEEELPGDLFGEVRLPEVAAALPKRLGNFPFWRGRAPFLEALEPFYLKAALSGMDIYLGIAKPQAEEDIPLAKLQKPVKSSVKVTKTLKGKSRPKRRTRRKNHTKQRNEL
ncbi:MAG: SWIM zinc finger family protein [Deltaproteobacteria bacterium]|nr:SWIM zinc finger family protein [Deltaproteobacteria bacterium]